MELTISCPGECRYPSPLRDVRTGGFRSDTERVLFDDSVRSVEETLRHGQALLGFEQAGPLERLYFDPPKTTAAVLTCGGICPGGSRAIVLNLKYIDASYIIRSVPGSPQDNVYCSQLAQYAVHAGMAGKTNMLVGRRHGTFVHVPFELVINRRRKVDPDGDLWHSVLECTGQPARML